MPEPLPWVHAAACAGHPEPEMWFPTESVQSSRRAAEAIAICSTCPVQADCLEHALADPVPDGIWGGLSYRQRIHVRRSR